MYFTREGQPLKTKIIATMGTEGRTLFDPKGKKWDDVKYETLFQWYVQPDHNSFMVDALRVNMAFYSSGKEKEPYKRIFSWLKKERKRLAKNVGVLCDLAGAKTRLGEIHAKEGAKVEGDFQLSMKDSKLGNQKKASLLAYGRPLKELNQYRSIKAALRGLLGPEKPGLMITVGDGKTVLRAYNEQDDILFCKIEKEGIIKSNWGITFEGVDLGLPSFQIPDQEALEFILNLDGDQGFISHIGVSFVRKAQDILDVREFVEDHFIQRKYPAEDARLRCPYIIAKIETKEGAENIREILDVADGAMIARGDLALQLGREEVPQKQKEIISLCNRRGKIVITATEMLASMEDNPEPTRAEVNDVFNAIMDGTDAVMLSGETASGKYPSQAVKYMAKIAERAEKYYETIYVRKSPLNTQRIQELRRGSEVLIEETSKRLDNKRREQSNMSHTWAENLYREKLEKSRDQGTTDRICAAACELAEEEEFGAIVASTASGRTIKMLSRFRPSVKLIGTIYDEKSRRKMLLSYGVCPLSIGKIAPSTGAAWQNPEEAFKKAAENCLKEKLCQRGTHVIFVSGTPLGKRGQGKVNILQIKEI